MGRETVGVVLGGPSSEHEVSLRSAATVVAALSRAGHRVLPVRVEKHGGWSLGPVVDGPCEHWSPAGFGAPLDAVRGLERLAATVDVVFPCVHGRWGEDGVLQGCLEACGIPCVGCGVLSSSLCMDKQRSKLVVSSSTGVAVPVGRCIERTEWTTRPEAALASLQGLAPPWIVKPADGGSSVGLTRVDAAEGIPAAFARAFALPETGAVLVEEFLEGREITSLVVGNPERAVRALPPVLIEPSHGGLFDYQAKYEPGGARETCPAPLEEGILARVDAAAVAVFRALACRGIARVDFILHGGEPCFLECNTVPGYTNESLAPRAARAAGMELPEFFSFLVELALETHSRGVRRGA